MASVSEIVAAVGRANLREKLGVSDTAISNALSRKVFPPKWYRLLKSECEAINVDCPMDLFSFTPPTEQNTEAA